MGDYRNLVVWQRSMDLVDAVYAAVRDFAASEQWVLGQQMRRAAVSIPSNIAEGRGRYSRREERRFFRQARGSTYELQTQIEIAVRQKLLTAQVATELTALAAEVGRRINAFLNSMAKAP